MDKTKKQALAKLAADIRLDILEEVHAAASGHPGGSLSIAEILAYLYGAEMRIDPANPKKDGRDRLVLSKWHTAPALYAVLAEKGYFPKEELPKFRQIDSFLQGHPDMKGTPGVEMTIGPDSFDREITNKLFALPEGAISDIVETSDGLYIFCCKKKINEAETQKAEEEAFAKICKEYFQELYEKWRSDTKVEINEALWNAM